MAMALVAFSAFIYILQSLNVKVRRGYGYGYGSGDG